MAPVEVSSGSLVNMCVYLACFDSCLTLWPLSPEEGVISPNFNLTPWGEGGDDCPPALIRKAVLGPEPLPDLLPHWLSGLWGGPYGPFPQCLHCGKSVQVAPSMVESLEQGASSGELSG